MFRLPPVLSAMAVIGALMAACGADDAPAYDVSVTFNAQYRDPAAAEVERIVLALDDDADVRLQESFPPVLRATLRSRREDVCEQLLRQLSARTDVANLACDAQDPD